MNVNDLKRHPLLQNISPEKMTLFTTLIEQADGKTQKEMMPFLLAASASARKQGISFTPDEFQLIFEVLKQGKSSEERAKMDHIVEMAKKQIPR